MISHCSHSHKESNWKGHPFLLLLFPFSFFLSFSVYKTKLSAETMGTLTQFCGKTKPQISKLWFWLLTLVIYNLSRHTFASGVFSLLESKSLVQDGSFPFIALRITKAWSLVGHSLPTVQVSEWDIWPRDTLDYSSFLSHSIHLRSVEGEIRDLYSSFLNVCRGSP